MAESVKIQAFVRAPYDAYVHDETRFWNASGISVTLGGSGLHVQMESLRALLFGGIAFDTTGREGRSPPAQESHVFPLFAHRDAARSSSYTRIIRGVSYFDGSIHGLAPGAEVTLHGLKIGEVTEVRLTANHERGQIFAKVRFSIAAGVKLALVCSCRRPFCASADDATRGSRFSSRSAPGRLTMG
jgi:paraquat-inducible protein B